MSKIKICGLKREEDILLVNRLCPDYCGFIINFPKSHRSLGPDQVRALVKKLKKDQVIPVGVFVDRPVEEVAALLKDGTIQIAQLHGHENEEYIAALRKLTSGSIMKAFTIHGEEDLTKAARCSADYILLDQGQGCGESFDWSLLKADNLAYQEIKKRKWFLAGGLNENNIEEAIRLFEPYCVDLSSAVETEGFKDPVKVASIIEKVRNINVNNQEKTL